MTKMISFDPIETRDGIKIIAESEIWIQNSKKLFSYGIGLFLLAILLGLGIHKYQDQIQELDNQITQSIKDTLEPLGPYLEEAKAKILGFLGPKHRISRTIRRSLQVLSLPSAFSTEPESEE